jgi:hypothetical protein
MSNQSERDIFFEPGATEAGLSRLDNDAKYPDPARYALTFFPGRSAPRPVDGAVITGAVDWRNTEEVIEDVDRRLRAQWTTVVRREASRLPSNVAEWDLT